jgi:hypothetical protein
VHKIEELINNPTYRFVFSKSDDPALYNDDQAKSLVSEFFGVLSSGQFSVMEAVSNYPIMDKLLCCLFRSLMILSDEIKTVDEYLPRDSILGFLCPFFGIEVELHDETIKYVETDVFVYDYDAQAVYMAYMDYSLAPPRKELEPAVVGQEKPSGLSQLTVGLPQEPAQSHGISNPIKSSYVANEFMDYTHDNRDLTLGSNTVLKGSSHDLHQGIANS